MAKKDDELSVEKDEKKAKKQKNQGESRWIS